MDFSGTKIFLLFDSHKKMISLMTQGHGGTKTTVCKEKVWVLIGRCWCL